MTMSLAAGTRALAAGRVPVTRLVREKDISTVEVLLTDKALTEGQISVRRSLSATGADSVHPLLLALLADPATVQDPAPSAETRSTWPCGNRRTPQTNRSPATAASLPFDHERAGSTSWSAALPAGYTSPRAYRRNC
jgi:hypothetical protein